ncbi:MAG: cytochrome b/b6 domain-containing protein [Candidatus Eremiobacteraeota bacterium]|nr:cytochrome b/b6 domain-containing protein [Candidatus Eremiobacteraeota bacterium]
MDSTVGHTSARSAAVRDTGRVVKRHSVATRVTHWVVALAMVILIMSGLQIFNAAPYLDASDLSSPQHRILSIGTSGTDLNPIGTTTLFGHRFTTTNWLGYTDDGQGSKQARAFPGWITFPGYQDLASGRRWHFFFGWVLTIFGVIYLVAGVFRKDLRLIVLRRSDFPKIGPYLAYYLRLRKEPPDHGKYNPLQKAGYNVVLFGLIPLVVITGLALSPGIDSIAHPLTTILGGRQFARTLHFIIMMLLIAFIFGHVFLVVVTGLINNMRSMTLGTYRLGKHEGTGP